MSGDFSYAGYMPPGGQQIKGWLIPKEQEQIIFAPPRIVKMIGDKHPTRRID